MENRDFKGVWIPKEIWLNKELTMNEKVIYTEISSLDNENHCIAGNEYFAEFCGIGVATVTRSIKHLEELGYIKILSFDGRHRVIKVISLPNQNDESDSSKRLTNNIDNSKSNKHTLSKDNVYTEEFFGSAKVDKPKKKSLYQQCMDYVDDTIEDLVLRENVKEWVKFMFNLYREQSKTLYLNVVKNKINRLLTFKPEDRISIVLNALDNGWQNFYEESKSYRKPRNKSTFGEDDNIKSKKGDFDSSGEMF